MLIHSIEFEYYIYKFYYLYLHISTEKNQLTFLQ
jgi:hypothetical protein